jgi:hypothetical protein
MASQHQYLYYGVTGQNLIWDAPEGRPSSVTDVQIFGMGDGDDGTEQTAPGAGAVETGPNTTFDANSGANQTDRTVANLAATTGVAVGRSYLATDAKGRPEWLTVVGLTSGASVVTSAPMLNSYVSGDAFVSTRITSTIDATWIATSAKISDDTSPQPGYRVRWTYVVDSVTYVQDSYFDVSRYASEHSVTPADMRNLVYDWDDRLPTWHRDDNGQRIIDESYRELELELKRADHPPEMIRDAATLDRLTMYYARRAVERPGTDEWIFADQQLRAAIDGMIRVTTVVAESTDTSGAGVDTTATSLWTK